MMDFFLTAVTIIAVGIVLLLYLSRSRKRPAKSEIRAFREIWRNIETESNRTQALIMADKLVDTVMKRHGYRGTFGEKLKKYGKTVFSDLDGLWFAHKLRNRVAHEIHFEPSTTDVDRARSAYRRALQDMGV